MNKLSTISLTGLFSLLIMTLVWSCKPAVDGSDRALLAVPLNAGAVTQMNFQNLMDKADFEGVKKMEFFAKLKEDAKKENPLFSEILENPAKTGIALSSNAYIFTSGDAKKGNGGLVLALSSAADFEKLIKEAKLGDIQTDNGINYVQSRGTLIGWNEDLAFAGGGFFNQDAKEALKPIFNTDPSKSVSSHSDYKKRMGAEHDFATWVNLNPVAEALPGMAKMGMVMAGISDEDMKDNFLTGYWDFEDGVMKGNLEYFLKKGLTKDFSAFFKNKVDTDFSSKLPGEGLGAAFSIALDFKGVNQILKEKGMQDRVEDNVKVTGVTFDELSAALGGDIAMAFYPIVGTEEASEVLMSTNISNEATIQKLIDFGVSKGMVQKEGDFYRIQEAAKQLRKPMSELGKAPMNAGDDAFLLVKGDFLYLGTSQAMIEKVNSGDFKKASNIKGLEKAITNNIFNMFMNFEAVGPLLEEFDASKFEEMTFDAGRDEANVFVKTSEKGQNSLKSLMHMINEQYKKDEVKLEM